MVSNSYNSSSSHHAFEQAASGPASQCLGPFVGGLQLSCLEIGAGEFGEPCLQAQCLQIVKLCKYSQILLLTTNSKLGRNVIWLKNLTP